MEQSTSENVLAAKDRQPGTPHHRRDRRTARSVERMVSAGLTKPQVADCLELSVEQLERHYDKELRTGLEKSITLAEKSLYLRALRGDTTALIFWLKSRAHWRDRDPVNVQVAQVTQGDKLDIKQIEDALFAALGSTRSLKVQAPKLLPAPPQVPTSHNGH